ncbi:MAG: carboxy terminal-processing peptidase [Lewinellaceae bacterium]|nr:carboxy terminal-processing peptidase [Lewinellaceae bacterium]
MEADPTFQKINENAMRLRKQKDQTEYPLQLEKYQKWDKKLAEEAEKYDNMFKPIDGFLVENLAADLPNIQSDTSRIARNDNWLKERKKDIQLFETYRIMQDMIKMDALAGKN